jgi:hypothetical protein
MFAIALLADGGAVVTADSVIRRFNTSGQQVKTYDSSGQDAWFALTLDPDGTSFWASDGDTGEVYRFDLSTGNKRSSFSTGLTVPPGVGGVAVGGLSIMPNIGAMSQQIMKTTRWGFDAPSPGQPHGTKPTEDAEPE